MCGPDNVNLAGPGSRGGGMVFLALLLGLGPSLAGWIVDGGLRHCRLKGPARAFQRRGYPLNLGSLAEQLLAHEFRRRRQHTTGRQRDDHRHD